MVSRIPTLVAEAAPPKSEMREVATAAMDNSVTFIEIGSLGLLNGR
jgi:hypothetical protein